MVDNQLLWQGGGLPGESRAGDRLGASVTYRGGFAAFGIPGKDADGIRDSGSVVVHDGATYSVLTQDAPGVPDKSERSDAFGAAVAIGEDNSDDGALVLAVGAPGEDVKRQKDAGAMTYVELGMAPPMPTTISAYKQPTTGLRSGDRFGSSLVVVEGRDEETNPTSLLAGAPGRDRSGARNAGRYYWTWTGWKPDRIRAFATGISTNERLGQ